MDTHLLLGERLALLQAQAEGKADNVITRRAAARLSNAMPQNAAQNAHGQPQCFQGRIQATGSGTGAVHQRADSGNEGRGQLTTEVSVAPGTQLTYTISLVVSINRFTSVRYLRCLSNSLLVRKSLPFDHVSLCTVCAIY